MITLDSFCAADGINQIDILKTDTEGYDLNVLRGAQTILRDKVIRNIVSEASISESDAKHTPLKELMTFLEDAGFRLYSLYDLHHSGSGELVYFNAHFKLVPLTARAK